MMIMEMKDEPKNPPPTTGPDRKMPLPSHYPGDHRAYEMAMAKWWKDVEDNTEADPEAVERAIQRFKQPRSSPGEASMPKDGTNG